MSIMKKVMPVLIGLCALAGVGGVIITGLIIYTRSTADEPPEQPIPVISQSSSTHTQG